MASDTRLHVVCHNPDCVYFERVRSVRMPHLGQGVFARPSIVCECNPTIEMRYATSDTSGAIYDELTLFEQGGHLVPATPGPIPPSEFDWADDTTLLEPPC